MKGTVTFRIQVKTGIAAAVLLILTTGCGEMITSNSRYVYGENGETYNSTTGLDPGFSCPSSPNVVPDYDDTASGSIGHYTVCKAEQSATTIRIRGETRGSDTICLFPALYVSASNIQVKKDTSGNPIAVCKDLADATDRGLTIELKGIHFNYLYIAEAPYAGDLQMYLKTGNTMYEPAYYAHGKVR